MSNKPKAKRGASVAKEILKLLQARIEMYQSNSLYPAFGLNSMVQECQEIADEISDKFGIEPLAKRVE